MNAKLVYQLVKLGTGLVVSTVLGNIASKQIAGYLNVEIPTKSIAKVKDIPLDEVMPEEA